MTKSEKALAAWKELNSRQQLYLGTVYGADQAAEARATSSMSRRPASEWRWLLYSVNAPKALVGRTTIQGVVEQEGQLDTGAGSSLAALRRRGLLESRSTTVFLAGLGEVPAVEVMLTKEGRAAVRAGLGIAAPKKPPAGLLSKPYLWDAMAWLYEAGEEGFEHIYLRQDQPAEQTRWRPSWNTLLVLRDRRDGAFWEHPKEDGAPDWQADYHRYRLSPLGRAHYERHWACYADLYPDVDAPRPPAVEGAHQGVADHQVRKPRGLLTVASWRLLVALVDVHRAGASPLHRIIGHQCRTLGRAVPDLSGLPFGLLSWHITSSVTKGKTAASSLTRYKTGPLAQYTDVAEFSRLWTSADGTRVPLLHVTEAGLAHYDDHLPEYERIYPDVPVIGPEREAHG